MFGILMVMFYIVGVLVCFDLVNVGFMNLELFNYVVVYVIDLGELGYDYYYGYGMFKLKQYLDNLVDGNEEFDELDDLGDGGDNFGIICENCIFIYELEGEWIMLWMIVQVFFMKDEFVFIIDFDKNIVVNFDGVVIIIYIQVVVEINIDVGIIFELMMDNMNIYYYGCGLGL